VCLIDHKDDRTEHIRKSGISVVEGNLEYSEHVPIIASLPEFRDYDVVFICVKAFDVSTVLLSLTGRLGETNLCILLNNGLVDCEVCREMGSQTNLTRGLVYFGVETLDEGKVALRGKGPVLLGSTDEKTDTLLPKVVRHLNQAGVESQLSDDFQVEMWRKLIINAAVNPLTALLGIRNGELPRHDTGWEDAKAIVSEGVEVARAEGVKLELGEVFSDLSSTCQKTARNRSSMLQDFSMHRKTEIDFINGAIVERAGRHGIPAPANSKVVKKIKSGTVSE
jgi:2-dehydropantoate 2-reductase